MVANVQPNFTENYKEAKLLQCRTSKMDGLMYDKCFIGIGNGIASIFVQAIFMLLPGHSKIQNLMAYLNT